MAYERTVWVKGQTPLSAENFNNIEEGIEQLNSDLENKIGEVKKEVDDNAQKLADLIITRDQWLPYTVAATSSTNKDITPPSVSGYKFLYAFCAATNSPRVTCHYCVPPKIYFWNNSTGSASASALIKYVYIRS